MSNTLGPGLIGIYNHQLSAPQAFVHMRLSGPGWPNEVLADLSRGTGLKRCFWSPVVARPPATKTNFTKRCLPIQISDAITRLIKMPKGNCSGRFAFHSSYLKFVQCRKKLLASTMCDEDCDAHCNC